METPAEWLKMFQLDPNTGEDTLLILIDNEEAAVYEIDIWTSDGGGFSGHWEFLEEVVNVKTGYHFYL